MTDQPNEAGQLADLPASLAQSNVQTTTATSAGVANAGQAASAPQSRGIQVSASDETMRIEGNTIVDSSAAASSGGAAAQDHLGFAMDPDVVVWREQLIEEILARLAAAAPAPAPAPTAPAAAPVPSIGRIVIVRAAHRKDAPGIVTDTRSDTVIDVQVFRGDHLPHAFQSLSQIDPTNTTSTGWFWPPRT